MESRNDGPITFQASTKQQECQLLQLPSEVRNQIYELVVLSDRNIVEVRKGYKTPPLLATCHQVRSEAGKLYYGSSIFAVKAERGSDHEFAHRSAPGLCILWLLTRAFGASKHVRRVRLDLYTASSKGWMDVWKPIALQIVRDKITSLGLGENIQVDAIDAGHGVVTKMY